ACAHRARSGAAAVVVAAVGVVRTGGPAAVPPTKHGGPAVGSGLACSGVACSGVVADSGPEPDSPTREACRIVAALQAVPPALRDAAVAAVVADRTEVAGS
ncbi:MAG: hypothetical protein WBA00_07885, partial [Rhodococcus sp. (in: high G+C Gram-positive bacteria)]